MKYIRFYVFSLILAVLFISPLYSQQWQKLPGSAIDISIGANGSLWVVGNSAEKYGNYIYNYDPKNNNWKKSPTGIGITISVDPDGRPWIIDKKGHIFRKKGKNWQELPGTATDICAANFPLVYITGTDECEFGYSIFKWNEKEWKWNIIDGVGVKIAVEPDKKIWIINKKKEIFRRHNKNWQQLPGKANDISIGADGTVWIIGTDSQDFGSSIYKWNDLDWIWEKQPGSAIKISGDANGKAYIVNSEKSILYKIK